jgi:fumarate hydratase class II
MGAMEVPSWALYGASTQRAVLNFPMSGRPVPEKIIKAYAVLKAACAKVNQDLGRLDEGRARLIREACRVLSVISPSKIAARVL